MSQEANPYLVTSVGLVTKMPYDEHIENIMKERHLKRITMNQKKADLKAGNRQEDETHVPGKHSARHRHQKNIPLY
jgi:hypothetical protein